MTKDRTSPSPAPQAEGIPVSRDASAWVDVFHDEARAVFDREPTRYYDVGDDGKKHVTERHATLLFVDAFGDEVRFVQDERNRWYVCSRTARPGYWSKENRRGAHQRMRGVLRVLSRVTGQDLETSGRVKSRLDLAASDVAVSPTAFNADPMRLGALNGVVDLRTGKIEPVRPDMLMTKSAGVEYDSRWRDPAHMVGIDTWDECPAWADHLRVMFRTGEAYDSPADPEELAFIQELVGMTLVGDQNLKTHVFVWLFGAGRNGKGVFMETLRHILKDYVGELDTQILFRMGHEHTTGFVDLMGTRLATFNEVPRGRPIDTATLKRITGGGILKGRNIGQDNVEWNASHTLWMASNALPDFGVDRSVGMWSRVILIPTGPPIPDADRSLEVGETLRREGPAILAWAVEGAVRFLQRQRLPEMPKRFKLATQMLEESSNLLQRFIEQRYTRDAAEKTALQSVRLAYESWLRDEGELGRYEKGPSSRELKGQLDDLGLQLWEKKDGATGGRDWVRGIKPAGIK